ncbi:MFS transporter [Sciscionella marina]|uniref:MFS transporter n=1 Tax=Sciscionella marina TaxID=508770 RepID=UPI0003800E3E|nr:MFS transporter [Sciscionella marina]
MSALLEVLRTEAPRPRRIVALRSAPWLAVGAVCFGAFLGQLDASIVTLAFGGIRDSFGSSLAAVQWVSLAYLLTLVALLVPVGRLADRFGRKQLYLYGFAVFTAASAACGMAPSLGWLIVFRVLQACGAALLQANSVALVSTAVPAERRRGALGMQAAAQALGLAIGPLIGGVLVDGLGWRWVFLVNLPVGALGLVAGYLLLPRTRERCAPGPVAITDPVLLALGAGLVLFGLSSVSGLDVPAAVPPCALALGVLALAGFVLRQRRSRIPLVPPWLFSTRVVRAGLSGALVGYLVLFGPLVLVPALLPEDAGLAGAVTTALPAGFAVAATLGSRLLPEAWSSRRRGVAGGVLCVLALLVLVFAATPVWLLAVGLFVLGIGLGLFTPANNALVMSAVPASFSGLTGGMVNMARGIGTALGVCVVTLVVSLAPVSALAVYGFGVLAFAAVLVVLAAARTN